MFLFLLIVIILFIAYKKHQKKLEKERIADENYLKFRKEQEKHEQYILERKNQFETTLNDIEFLKPTIYEEKTNRKYLKDFPIDINIRNVTKKTTLKDLQNFIVIDVETTGLKPATDEIIEISMVKFVDSDPVQCLSSLIKPKKEIPYEATKINNITNDMVENCANISNIILDFNKFIEGYNIVGYNLEFDLKFLHCNGIDFFSEKRKFYDCLLLTRKYFKSMTDSFKLDNITTLCNIYRTNNHRATEDALATGIIFRDIGEKIINTKD